MADKLIRFVASEAEFRGSVVSMAETANTLFHQHEPSQQMGAYLCDTAAAAVLLASNIKNGAISVRIESSGIIGLMNSDATPDGFVRAMISRHNIEDEEVSTKLKLPMIGSGTFSVVKKLDLHSPPYNGVVEIGSPYIGPMVADYLLNSEQIKSSVAVATHFNHNDVLKCYGFYIEALPKLTDDDLNKVENNIIDLGNFRDFTEQIKQPEEILEEILSGFKFDIIRETPIRFYCTCGVDKVLNAIRATGPYEVGKIIEEKKDLEVFCDYCRKRYVITIAELTQGLLK